MSDSTVKPPEGDLIANPPETLTRGEAAWLLEMSLDTVDRMRDTGILRFVRLDDRILVCASDVADAMRPWRGVHSCQFPRTEELAERILHARVVVEPPGHEAQRKRVTIGVETRHTEQGRQGC